MLIFIFLFFLYFVFCILCLFFYVFLVIGEEESHGGGRRNDCVVKDCTSFFSFQSRSMFHFLSFISLPLFFSFLTKHEGLPQWHRLKCVLNVVHVHRLRSDNVINGTLPLPPPSHMPLIPSPLMTIWEKVVVLSELITQDTIKMYP